MHSGRVAAKMEEMGLPTVVIAGRGFEQPIDVSFRSRGFSEGPPKVVFPLEMFLPSGDLTDLERNIEKVIAGLTTWQPEATKAKVAAGSLTLEVTGRDFEDALVKMNQLFVRNAWGDGIPVYPPTRERVEWLMSGTELRPDALVASILPKGGAATVHSLAIQLAMAGGRPEYLPVLIAIIEAIAKPGFEHRSMNATTCGDYPAVIVNGPITRQLGINSGYGCMGPDPKHPAGASIGRALRLAMMNLGGSIPARGSMSIYGGPARAAGIVFAEDEDGLPPGWEPVSVELGFSRESNVVTVHAVASATNVGGTETGDREQALACLNRYAGFLEVPSINYFSYTYDGSPGIAVLARHTAAGIAKHLGFTKGDVKRFLWENSKLPWAKVERNEMLKFAGREWDENVTGYSRGNPLPITSKPENIVLAVAGGEQSGHGYWMQVGCCPPAAPMSAEIKLPGNWADLLKKAGETQ